MAQVSRLPNGSTEPQGCALDCQIVMFHLFPILCLGRTINLCARSPRCDRILFMGSVLVARRSKLANTLIRSFAACIACWPLHTLSQVNSPVLEEIDVIGQRLSYALEPTPAPVLVYDSRFFTSFEPQTVGDMLRRVSGVAFTSDIGEYTAPQLRGLGAEYTQVLVDGVPIPGSVEDRTAYVDRIPAELIERIELRRANSADTDAQGIGGTINLILKTGRRPEATQWRLGGLYYTELDSTARGSAALSHSARVGAYNYLLAANIQERLGPKTKAERHFDPDGRLVGGFQASDVLDSRDNSLLASMDFEGSEGSLLQARIAFLDNTQEELESFQVWDEQSQLSGRGVERRRASQNRLDLALSYRRELAPDMLLRFDLVASDFWDRGEESESELEGDSEVLTLQQSSRADSDALLLSASLKWSALERHELEAGWGLREESRRASRVELERDDAELLDVSPAHGNYAVEETRFHSYVLDRWNLTPTTVLEYGLRAEATRLHQRGADGSTAKSQLALNPSAHLLHNIGRSGQLRLSLARALRRPRFDEIIPFTRRDSPDEDQITVGNPGLEPEISDGVDLGYWHQDGQVAVGLNLFYRRIEDKIELRKIRNGLYTPDNVGSGTNWGLEFDLATTLAAIGLSRWELLANYSLVDSAIKDPFTGQTRRFNRQPSYVANVDMIHRLPEFQISHGISIQRQGNAEDFQLDESKRLSYGTNLEYFIEKRMNGGFLFRLSVNNLLDAHKSERGRLYSGLAALQAGDIEESVIEREQTEPVLLLTIRGRF